MTRSMVLACLVTFSMSSACKTVAPQAAGSDVKFVGGEAAPEGKFPATLFLGGCTAARIGAREILTAAHCVVDTSGYLRLTATPGAVMTVSHGASATAQKKFVVEVEDTFVHPLGAARAISPGWSMEGLHKIADLAIIRLKAPLDAAIKIAVISPDTLNINQSVFVGGYGREVDHATDADGNVVDPAAQPPVPDDSGFQPAQPGDDADAPDSSNDDSSQSPDDGSVQPGSGDDDSVQPPADDDASVAPPGAESGAGNDLDGPKPRLKFAALPISERFDGTYHTSTLGSAGVFGRGNVGDSGGPAYLRMSNGAVGPLVGVNSYIDYGDELFPGSKSIGIGLVRVDTAATTGSAKWIKDVLQGTAKSITKTAGIQVEDCLAFAQSLTEMRTELPCINGKVDSCALAMERNASEAKLRKTVHNCVSRSSP